MKALNIRHRPPLKSLMEYQTLHVKADRQRRLNGVRGKKVVDAFLTFDKHYSRSAIMHYITDAAEDVLYDVEGDRVITVTMLRPSQLVEFYKKSGSDAPGGLMNEAKINKVFDRNQL